MMSKVALLLLLVVITMQQDIRGGSIPGTPTPRPPFEPPIITQTIPFRLDPRRGQSSAPTGKG